MATILLYAILNFSLYWNRKNKCSLASHIVHAYMLYKNDTSHAIQTSNSEKKESK